MKSVGDWRRVAFAARHLDGPVFSVLVSRKVMVLAMPWIIAYQFVLLFERAPKTGESD